MPMFVDDLDVEDEYEELDCVTIHSVPHGTLQSFRCAKCNREIYLGTLFYHGHHTKNSASENTPITGSCFKLFGAYSTGWTYDMVCHECALPMIELLVDDENMTEHERFNWYEKALKKQPKGMPIRCRRRMPTVKTKSARNKSKVAQ